MVMVASKSKLCLFQLLITINYTAAEMHFYQNPPTHLQKFVIDLINQDFWNCTLMLFQDGKDNSETTDLVAYSTKINLFSIKFHYPFRSNKSLQENQTLPVTFPTRVGNYHRRSPPCSVIVMMIEETKPEYFREISKMLSPVFIPILKKDEDHYIFITRREVMEKILLIKELPMRIKYRLAIAENPDGSFVIRSACFYCDAGFPKIVELKNELNTSYLFPDFVKNFHGRTLRITAPYVRSMIEVEDWVGLKNAKRGHWKYMLEQYLMVKFNFTYIMFVSLGGGGTGLKLPNGTWFGTTGDIVAGNADFGVATVGTPLRLEVVDYTTQYDYGYLTFVTSKGTRIFTPATLLWPFHLDLWLCTISSALFCFLFFAILNKVMQCYNRNIDQIQSWSLRKQIEFALGTILDQSVTLPSAQPLRAFVALWLFFTLVSTTMYRSKMVSLMAFPVMEALPKTFEELAYSDYKVGFMKHGDSAYNTLAISTDPVYVKLVAEMKIIRGWGTDCLSEVVKSRFACICYDFSLRHLTQRNLSDQDIRSLVIAPAVTYNIPWCLVMETKAIFRLNFGRWIGYTIPQHLPIIWEKMDFANVRRLKREWWFHTNQSYKAKKSDNEKSADLTLKHISGAFYVLFGGLVLSLTLFLMEFGKFFCRRSINCGVSQRKLSQPDMQLIIYSSINS